MTEFSLKAVFPSVSRAKRGVPIVLGSCRVVDKMVYCNGTYVYIVTIGDLMNAEIYAEHSHMTTVAKVSPDGKYCASGDIRGNIRVWSMENMRLKLEKVAFGGLIRDIAWCPESKKIAVVGGENNFPMSHIFMIETGSSCGDLTGQTRALTSVEFVAKHVLCASEDSSLAVFEGPPYKFNKMARKHTKAINQVRTHPNGQKTVTVSQDGTLRQFILSCGIYNGIYTDKNLYGEIAHVSGVMGVAWCPDETKIATVSTDRTMKIWQYKDWTLLSTYEFGQPIANQQLGVIWTRKAIVTVAASGFMYCFNHNGAMVQIRRGHNKPITTLGVWEAKNMLFSGDVEGRIIRWEIATGKTTDVFPDERQYVHHGAAERPKIAGLCITENSELITVSWDDKLRIHSSLENMKTMETITCDLSSQPKGVAASADGSVIVVACYSHLAIYTDGRLAEIPIEYNSTCVALSKNKKLVAVGGETSNIYVYEVNGAELIEVKTISQSASITAVLFSNNGEFLVATDQARKVVPYSVLNNFEQVFSNSWVFHNAKVECVAWSPDNRRLATGSVDTNLIIWDVRKPAEHATIIKGAHAKSSINSVLWLNETTVVSAGQDSNIKLWNVPLSD